MQGLESLRYLTDGTSACDETASMLKTQQNLTKNGYLIETR